MRRNGGRFEETRVEDAGDRLAVAVLRHRLSLDAEQLALEGLDNLLAAGKELLQQRDVIGEREFHSTSCSRTVFASSFLSRDFRHRSVHVRPSLYCRSYRCVFSYLAARGAADGCRVFRGKNPAGAGAAVLLMSQLEDGGAKGRPDS